MAVFKSNFDYYYWAKSVKPSKKWQYRAKLVNYERLLISVTHRD